MKTRITSEGRGLGAARETVMLDGGEPKSWDTRPVLMSETVHDATIYHQNGTANISGNPADLDLLNVTFTGPGGGGGDTYASITGGATSGSLAGGGYHGTYTNNYGGSVNFTNVERFNLHTGVYADNVITADGDDTIVTGDGNDTLQSGMGIDDIHGGLGDYDRWVADKSFASDAIVLDLTSLDPQSYLGTGDVTGIESLFLKTGSGNDVITGLVAYNNSNSIDGGAGDDAITLGAHHRYAADSVLGGIGDDLLVYTFTGAGADGGDTYAAISGGVTSGNLAGGYSGQLTNGYGGAVSFFGIERFAVETGLYDDGVKTGDGADTVSGNGGNDTLDTGKGVDEIDGGLGDYDRWVADKSFASDAIVIDFTSAAAQTYLGTGSVVGIKSIYLKTGSGADVITGRVAYNNSNSIDGGAGDDAITLGAHHRYAADTVLGGIGNDLLAYTFTGAGADGGDTYAAISGGVTSGNLTNGYSGQLTNGYSGTVTYFGIERFAVATGLYDDGVKTGDGADTVSGNGGNDTLDTGKGVDVIDGGAGAYDRWIADKGFATGDIVIDFTSAAAQTYLGTGSVVGIESIYLKTGSGNDVLTGHVLHGNANQIMSGGGADVITLGISNRYGDHTVNGGGGNDLLVFTWTGSGGGGGDTYAGVTSGALSGDATTGHAGSMTNGYGGNLTFSGIERFNISTGVYADSIKTGDGNDTVSAGDQDDVIDTGKGIDVVNGGAGNDRWIADKSGTNAKLKLDITLAGPQTYLTTGSVEGVESLFLKSGGGNDEITAWVSGNDNSITAGAGGDRITLGNYHRYGTNTVHGGDGHDRLNHTWTGSGGDGGDTYAGITGGITSGNITNGYTGQVSNGYGGILTFTGVEELNLSTGVYADNITTGNGHDTVSTGGSNDVISTGRGVDVVDGGTGNDYWTSDKAFADQDIDIDLTSAAPQTYLIVGSVQGIEGINITTGSGDDRIVCTQSQNSDFVATRAGSDKITLAGSHRYGEDTADGGLGKDRLTIVHLGDTYSNLHGGVTGGDFDSGYSGFITNDYGGSYTFSNIEHFSLFTGVYGDNLTTGGGRDLLDSDGGNDTLVAGDNADTLIGGAGADGMTGGLGADVFRYEAVAESSIAAGRDVIADFALGDRIDLAAIDAKSGTPADNKFDFVGTAAFSNKAGELRYSQDATNTFVEGDVNGDGVADWSVQVNGLYAFAATDFVL